jgi:hypothetical protein
MRVQVSPRLQVGYLIFIIYIYINGKVAEWSNAPVLKTGELQGSVSSNLTLSALALQGGI